MSALEKHYSVSEVAALWQLSEDTVRKLFRDESGVLKLGNPERRNKRGYVSLRIPQSVIERVHADRRKAMGR